MKPYLNERHDVEDALLEKNAELEAANKELEAFDYSIAHDLRAPLDRLRGFTEILQRQHAQALDDAGRELLARIADAGRSMDQLITDILALATATRGALDRSIVDVTALADSVAAALRKAEPLRDVEVTIARGMKARADAGLLRDAIENLLANAWKFTRARTPARIDFGCESAGGETIFSVRDNGAGFDPARARDVFKPFQRLHADGGFEGSGIGLATVERIVRRHGGRVWAEARVDGGATFYFTLSPRRPS